MSQVTTPSPKPWLAIGVSVLAGAAIGGLATRQMLLSCTTCTIDSDSPAPTAAVVPAPETAATPAITSAADLDPTFYAMGFAMGSQMRLDIGFSDSELDTILSGMRLAAEGGDAPAGFEESVQAAQAVYMSKIQAQQAVEDAQRAEAAEANKQAGAAYLAAKATEAGVVALPSGLLVKVTSEGEGDKPGPTDSVTVNYRGTLIDGTQFDAGNGVEFGLDRVVKGFSEGIQQLKPGGSAILYIPSDLAYGDAPSRPGSPIQPGSTLVFEVDLIKATPRAAVATPPVRVPTQTRPPGPPPNYTPPPPPNYTPPPPPSTPPPNYTPPPPPQAAPPPPPSN
jgi:FKBP-type peptidyl-prolyl cis-trans isomerase